MKCNQAEYILDEIEDQIDEIKKFSLTEKQNSYMAKYFVVYISGSLEESIKYIIAEWTTKFKSHEISRFVEKTIELFRNPTFDKVCKLFESFSNEWQEKLSKIENSHQTGLTSIINHKNALAHRGYTEITIDQIENFYYRAKMVIKKIDEIVLES